jgi:transcriptional regulator with XRE-family HTH domain
MLPLTVHLRAWRTFRGLTQEGLAEKAGVHRISIIRIESGEAANQRLGTLAALAGALGIAVPDLFFEAPAGRAAGRTGKAKRPARKRARG